jgi:hypothetical protein
MWREVEENIAQILREICWFKPSPRRVYLASLMLAEIMGYKSIINDF